VVQCPQQALFLDVLQGSLQEIDLQSLLADLTFQFGHPALFGALPAHANKRLLLVLFQYAPPAI
jgi:hypothetical protein